MTSSGRDGNTKVVAVPRPSDPGAGTPYLIVLRGRSAGELLSLSRPSYIVGRAEDADFHVDDDGISRHHARITVDAGVVTIEDLHSTNGTRVNDQILEQPCPLLDGDKISIGTITIVKFTCHGALQPAVSQHAHRDPLTQAYRLEYFDEHLRAEVSFSRRHHTALSLIMFDIDRFAPLRDRVGADVTDRILAEVARAGAALVANQHLFARIGTRSFAILSRTLTGGQARDLAERIRQDVAGVPFAVGGNLVDVTISAGVAALPVEGIDTPLAFTRLADCAAQRRQGTRSQPRCPRWRRPRSVLIARAACPSTFV